MVCRTDIEMVCDFYVDTAGRLNQFGGSVYECGVCKNKVLILVVSAYESPRRDGG
jgi:hypothetical protein